jgi:hypothetical protein
MKQTCDPPIVVDWAEASSLVVVLSAQEGIPGAKAELARREKKAQELDKSADIEKNNPNRDSKGRFTFGAGGPQGGGGVGGGAAVEGAEQAGAAEPYEETDDYRMRHQAPRRADEFGSPATNIGDEMMPGFYEKPQLYGSAYEQSDKESRSVLMSIRDKPNAPVTIYRAVPESVDKINPGDWVTLSPTYAKEHLRSNLSSGGKVLSQVIPAKDLWFDGNSINEFGYDPTD